MSFSLILGDPTPLIIGVGRALIHQSNLSKEKRRAVDIQMRSFNQMLGRWHMELNERRGDLIAEHNIARMQKLILSLFILVTNRL